MHRKETRISGCHCTFLILQCLIFVLQTLFDMLLLQSFDMDLLQPAAEAFLALICCHQVMTLLTNNLALSTQIVNPVHARVEVCQLVCQIVVRAKRFTINQCEMVSRLSREMKMTGGRSPCLLSWFFMRFCFGN